MIGKLERWINRWRIVMVEAPVEIIISVVYCLVALLKCEGSNMESIRYLFTFPICFSVIYAVNNLTRGVCLKWLYYAAGFSAIFFLWWEPNPDGSLYWVSLIVSQLIVFLSWKQWENRALVKTIFVYCKDLVSALCLATVALILMIVIYYSVIYIFDWEELKSWDFIEYVMRFAYLFLAPTLFLMFNIRREEEWETGRFASVLIHFIVSPALLVYMLILYLYIVKIIGVWSLPKGGVAYMVLGFITLMFCVKSIQPLLKRRYFDWFYGYFSWWVAPTVVLLWIGTLFRIREYGFTEARFYLLLITIIVSLTCGIFFWRRVSRYVWVIIGTLCILVLFSYIPGIQARDFGLRSQMARVERIADKLGIRNGIQLQPTEILVKDDSVILKQYKILYDAYWYVQKEKGSEYMEERYGYTLDRLKSEIIPAGVVECSYSYRSSLYLDIPDSIPVPVKGYDILKRNMYSSDTDTYSVAEGHLTIQMGGTIVECDLTAWFRGIVEKNGMELTERLTWERLKEYASQFQLLDVSDVRIVFGSITVNEKTAEVTDVVIQFILEKEQ